MVMISRPLTTAPRSRAASDARQEMKRAAQARLSGAVTSSQACNPADLTVAPFSRVSQFDFEDDGNVTVVEFTQAPDDDSDW